MPAQSLIRRAELRKASRSLDLYVENGLARETEICKDNGTCNHRGLTKKKSRCTLTWTDALE